jgi:hypothetical protein
MNPQRAIRLLTIASLVLAGASFAAGLMEDEMLPEPLRAWNADHAADFSTTSLVALAPIGVALFLTVIVASVALLQMKKWGAWLHLGSSAFAYPLLLLLGPFVQHSLTYFLDSLTAIVTGCLYGVAFFSTALERREEISPPASASYE